MEEDKCFYTGYFTNDKGELVYLIYNTKGRPVSYGVTKFKSIHEHNFMYEFSKGVLNLLKSEGLVFNEVLNTETGKYVNA